MSFRTRAFRKFYSKTARRREREILSKFTCICLLYFQDD